MKLAAAAASKRQYHTYLKDAVRAKSPGEMVHFQEGKGYWLAPRPAPAPRQTVQPPRAVDPVTGLVLQAGQIATNALAPEKAELERQRALAADRAKADQAAMLGLAKTVAEMQKGIGPGIQGAYQGAAGEIAGLAKGFSGAMGERMAASQAASVDFAKSQGASVESLGPNVQDAQDVAYGLGGYIPGASLAAQGAAANAWGQAVPAITAAALRGDYERALFEAKSQDDEYAQQLIATAAKYPQLRDQALQELRTYELQKGQVGLDKRQVELQERAQTLYEGQFGETKRQNAVEDIYRIGQLQLETAKAQAAVQAASDAGRLPNATLSKVYGYVVDGSGNPILSGGKKIKVVNTTAKGSGKSGGEGAQARAEAFRKTTSSMDEFVRSTFKEDGFWLTEFDPAGQPGNSSYRRARARLVKRFWPDVRSYATAAGRNKLRAEFGRVVDAVLASHGIVPAGKR